MLVEWRLSVQMWCIPVNQAKQILLLPASLLFVFFLFSEGVFAAATRGASYIRQELPFVYNAIVATLGEDGLTAMVVRL